MKKINSDLEKMNKDRRKAEEEYIESQERMLEASRIRKEGISDVEDLVIYIFDVIESVKHSEDLARMQNNPLIYSEAIGIRREMEKLLDLMGGNAVESIEGTEEKHRKENDGNEGYA